MKPRVERRKHPRIKDKNVGVKLSRDGFDTITQSLDISASGIYCKTDRPMPLMTKVQIVLSIPDKRRSNKRKELNIDGVVVREHPVKKEGKVQHYDVAIFFASLMPKERRQLAEYIDSKS
jgi:hypothetical protein